MHKLTLVGYIPLAIMRLSRGIQVKRRLVALFQLLPNSKVHDGQLVQQRGVSLFRVERPLGQAQLHHRPHLVAVSPLAVVFLDNLEEAGVVEAAILLQRLDLVGDVIELGLKLPQLRDQLFTAEPRLAGATLASTGITIGSVRAGVRLGGRRVLLELLKGGIDPLLEGVEALLLELGNLL